MNQNEEKKEGAAWYAVHTYSGYEDAVARDLRQRIESQDMQDMIFDVIVPKEKVIRVKGGKRVELEEKIYPGYVLVNMIISRESWHTVRNTPRVTGFVGAGGTDPVPMTEVEVQNLFSRIKNTAPSLETDFEVDEIVMISDGPFKEYEGRISDINQSTGKVSVLVSMFGRETSVELDFLQIKKL